MVETVPSESICNTLKKWVLVGWHAAWRDWWDQVMEDDCEQGLSAACVSVPAAATTNLLLLFIVNRLGGYLPRFEATCAIALAFTETVDLNTRTCLKFHPTSMYLPSTFPFAFPFPSLFLPFVQCVAILLTLWQEESVCC